MSSNLMAALVTLRRRRPDEFDNLLCKLLPRIREATIKQRTEPTTGGYGPAAITQYIETQRPAPISIFETSERSLRIVFEERYETTEAGLTIIFLPFVKYTEGGKSYYFAEEPPDWHWPRPEQIVGVMERIFDLLAGRKPIDPREVPTAIYGYYAAFLRDKSQSLPGPKPTFPEWYRAEGHHEEIYVVNPSPYWEVVDFLSVDVLRRDDLSPVLFDTDDYDREDVSLEHQLEFDISREDIGPGKRFVIGEKEMYRPEIVDEWRGLSYEEEEEAWEHMINRYESEGEVILRDVFTPLAL